MRISRRRRRVVEAIHYGAEGREFESGLDQPATEKLSVQQ